MKKNIILSVLLIIYTHVTYSQEWSAIKLIYKEIGNDDTWSYVLEKKKKGYQLQYESDEFIKEIQFDDSWKTLDYFIDSRSKSTGVIHAHREGNIINLTKGEDSETLSIDSLNWQQHMLSLAGFIRGEEKSIKFWLLSENFNDENLKIGQGIKPIKFVASKKKPQTIEINGKKVGTIRVVFTFPDIRSLFWKSEYWYRESDGILVKYIETRGGPGSPKYTIELIEEEIIR